MKYSSFLQSLHVTQWGKPCTQRLMKHCQSRFTDNSTSLGLLYYLCFFLLFLPFIGCQSSTTNEQTQEPVKCRTIVTTDGEVDDMDSFLRLLLYANEMQIEGIIFSSSQWHYSGDGKGTLFTSQMPTTARMYGSRTDLRWVGTAWMDDFLDAYNEVYPSLSQHSADYPTPEYLKSIVKVGNITFEGEMETDTEGSDFIKQIILDDKPGPVYVQIWGGTNTLARALKSIEDQYKGTPEWENIYKKVSDKVVIYAILDQDATYSNYVAPNWPKIKVIYNSSQFWCFAYAWPQTVPQELKTYMDGNWFKENILFDHGPLLAQYATWGDGHTTADPEDNYGKPEALARSGRMPYDFISEGDSPSYFSLIDMGLRSQEDPSWGGLGGRFIQSTTAPNRWEDGRHVADFNPYTGKAESSYSQVRWVPVLQNDFAARADWCVLPYDQANHRPTVVLKSPQDVTAAPGKTIKLKAQATDPDGNNLTYSWWPYTEVSTYPNKVEVTNAEQASTTFTVPDDAQDGQTIHLILQVSDDGQPTLTHFARVVITVSTTK